MTAMSKERKGNLYPKQVPFMAKAFDLDCRVLYLHTGYSMSRSYSGATLSRLLS